MALADAVRNPGDTDISVASTLSLPLFGTLDVVAASERYAYYSPYTKISVDAAVGATTLKVVSTALFLATGTVTINGNSMLYSVVDETTLSVPALAAAVRVTDEVRDLNRLRIAKPLITAIAPGDTINYYASYDSGDLWNVSDVWPGPYVWDLFAEVHAKETTPGNSVTSVVSGPTVLSVDRLLNATVFELEDASSFPTSVPYDVLLGENSGNIETLSVQQLSLRSRTYANLAADVSPGDTTVTLTSVNGPAGPANQFPNGGPYRVVIGPFTANAEVVEVTATDGVAVLTLSQPAVNSHLAATPTQVVLLADLIRVSPAAGDDHTGKIKYADRFGLYGAETQVAGADTVRPLYTSATLALGGADFNADAGVATFNFGSALNKVTGHINSVVTAGDGTIVLDDSSDFPTTGYPYVVYVDVGAGPLREERLHVTNNNTGTGTLTLSHDTVFGHAVGRVVEFRPGEQEDISYTSRVGAVLNFTPYILIESTHYKMEYLSPSAGTGFPRKNGFDFPLRLPVTVEDRVRFVIDLVRAAGVEVSFVSKR